MNNYIILAYALFLFTGAYFGGKAGSKVSVIAGIASGVCVLVGLWLIKLNAQYGYGFLVLISALLTTTFAIRYFKTLQFMPSGMLLVVTLLFFIFCLKSIH